jgi:hypothetical protein
LVEGLASAGGAAVLDRPPDRARFTSPRGGHRGRGAARPFGGQREAGYSTRDDALERSNSRAEEGAEGVTAAGARPGGYRGGGGGGRGSGAFRRGDRTAAVPDGAADVYSPSPAAATASFGGLDTASPSRSSHPGRGGRIGGGDAQPGPHTSRGRGGRGGGGRSGGTGGSEPASAAGPGPAYVLSPQSAAGNASSAATPA